MGVEIRDRAPAYRDPVLHSDALRLVVLREGGMIEETLATENERKCIYAQLSTYIQSTHLPAAGTHLSAHSQPVLRTRLIALLSALLFVFREKFLTCTPAFIGALPPACLHAQIKSGITPHIHGEGRQAGAMRPVFSLHSRPLGAGRGLSGKRKTVPQQRRGGS